jgi:general secretion pathway protein D
MTSRFARWCVAFASAALAFEAFAQAPAPASPPAAATPPAAPRSNLTPAGPAEEPVTLKLPDATIDTMLDVLGNLTGRTVLRPAQLQTQTYNLMFARPMSKAEAILAVETVLALNNIGVAPLGEQFIKVVDLQRVRQEAPTMISGSTLDLQPSGRVATKLFQLEFARVNELIPLFTGLLNPFYGGPVPLQNANAALITDSISNLQRVELLLQQLDKPVTAGMKPKFYTMKNGTKASDVVTKLRTILTGTLQTQLGTATSYSADDRTNQVIVVTDPRQWDFFTDLIEKLDQKSDPNTRNDVIYLKNAKATDVVAVLTKIISGQNQAIQKQGNSSVRPGQGMQPPAQPAAPGQPAGPTLPAATLDALGIGSSEFSQLMTLVNDDRSNSVVVSGTSDDVRLVKALIDKLDIVLAQVRIEVVVAEVSLDDQHSSGISALGLKVDGDKLVGFTGSTSGVSATNGTISRGASVSGPWDLAAEISINTTPRTRNNTITTVPTVVTSHGKQAKFFNGETRPVVTGTIQSAAGVSTGLSSSSTVTQQQIGTTLTVTPFIGVDGSVQLDMVLSVEDVTGEVLVDQNKQYVIGRRESTNYVTAKSGDIKVIGGLRKNSNLKSTNRLGPIPIIGDLLGSRSRGTTTTELVFFIRPTVLTNTPEVDNAEALKRINQWPSRDEVKRELDPNYVAPPKSTIDKLLQK